MFVLPILTENRHGEHDAAGRHAALFASRGAAMPKLRTMATGGGRLAAIALLAAALAAGAAAANQTDVATANGDATRGQDLITRLGCGACHVIPGIIGADGMVGPPLDHIASRGFLAGMLDNSFDNMVTWLRHPQQIVPGNAMPNLGLSEAHGRDIAAYLETLK
jgi:cytochrome c2